MLIAPGRPSQNGRLESPNGRVRDEFLNVSSCLRPARLLRQGRHQPMPVRVAHRASLRGR
ncbi:MAG: integrase core domain-containing protein [Terriglobales bacterium]